MLLPKWAPKEWSFIKIFRNHRNFRQFKSFAPIVGYQLDCPQSSYQTRNGSYCGLSWISLQFYFLHNSYSNRFYLSTADFGRTSLLCFDFHTSVLFGCGFPVLNLEQSSGVQLRCLQFGFGLNRLIQNRSFGR